MARNRSEKLQYCPTAARYARAVAAHLERRELLSETDDPLDDPDSLDELMGERRRAWLSLPGNIRTEILEHVKQVSGKRYVSSVPVKWRDQIKLDYLKATYGT